MPLVDEMNFPELFNLLRDLLLQYDDVVCSISSTSYVVFFCRSEIYLTYTDTVDDDVDDVMIDGSTAIIYYIKSEWTSS